MVLGGDGNDSVVGGRGDDVALLGADNNTFSWNPGDGSDTVEGQDGADTLQFNGANINEKFDLSANGSRLRFTRDIANIVMDVNGVESVQLLVRGGADLITIDDLTGTNVTNVNVELGVADGAVDRVIVNGTIGDDNISVVGEAVCRHGRGPRRDGRSHQSGGGERPARREHAHREQHHQRLPSSAHVGPSLRRRLGDPLLVKYIGAPHAGAPTHLFSRAAAR